ncbi:MAG: hypothetical protein FWD45_02630 [Coriobacteriia bacterium]|nr:hypothetical protein [Coriobacteriia bacterium]
MNVTDTGLANLEPDQVQSASRVILLELLGNLVVFIMCTLVCLQVYAQAQTTLDKSRALSELGQTAVSIIENWKAGSDIEDLCERFGGMVEDGNLTIYYNRDFQVVENSSMARYRLEVRLESSGASSMDGSFQSGEVSAYLNDELLMSWIIGRAAALQGGH